MQIKKSHRIGSQFFRFLLCGITATALHYALLLYFMEILNFDRAWLANGCAALIAIAFSFLGNKFFVFSSQDQSWLRQASRFILVYLISASVHSSVLFIWTDTYSLDYKIGFLIATTIQLIITFTSNKLVVFS